jgi:hypothetical protein
MTLELFLRRMTNPIRRAALTAALSLTAVGALMSAPAEAGDFVVRDATRYAENPNLATYGLKDIIVAYESSLWPAGASKATPDLNHIRNVYIPKIKSKNPDVVVLDIEVYKFTGTTTVTDWNNNINKLKSVIAVFKQEMPNTKIGYYLLMPERNWLAACGDPRKRVARTASWHDRNLRLQPLADAVDIIFPSLYTFYDDLASQTCWQSYAKANIAEAKMYGKPVWPFIWMKYHSNGKWISGAFWKVQLETIYNNANGVVIWSAATATDPWSWTAPWWVETKNFMTAKSLLPVTN